MLEVAIGIICGLLFAPALFNIVGYCSETAACFLWRCPGDHLWHKCKRGK